MSGKYVYLVLYCVMLSAHSYQRIKTVCEQSSCLYLYESDNRFIPWDGSRRACRDEGLEMLSIESSQTQTTVDRLLQDLPPTTLRQVWIGGRRSSDDTWRYMNGTEFHRPVTFTDSSNSDLNCVYVRLCKDRNPEYQADNCDEKKSTSRVLCQYDKSQTGECRPSDYGFGQQKCYVKTPYDGSQSNKTDWYGGQTYCSQSRIQGDLAYSYLDDNSSMNSVHSLFNDDDGCALIWLGVRRRIWFWRPVSDSDGQSITFFNWFDNSQIQPSYYNCIYVDSDNGNKWRTQSCYNYLRYFICTNATTTATNVSELTTTATNPNTPAGNPTTGSKDQQKGFATTTATNVSELTTTATNQNTPAGNPTTESKDQQKGFVPVYAISMSIVGTLIVLGAVGSAVFFIRNKKKKQHREKYVNEHFHKSSANRRKAEDPEYAEVGKQNGTDYDDVIDPYGVTGGSDKPKKIKHSVAPSGDLYALPRQKKNEEEVETEVKDEHSKSTSTASDSKGNGMKYREAPSGDLYAVPEKKGNNSTEEQSNGIEETCDDDIYSLAKGIPE